MRTKPGLAFVFVSTMLWCAHPAVAASVPSKIELGRMSKGLWTATAWTDVGGSQEQPTVADIGCYIWSNGLEVQLSRKGDLRVLVFGDDPQSPSGEQFGSNIKHIKVGAVNYETAMMTINRTDFSDVKYTGSPNDIVVMPYRGYLAVRQNSSLPWLHVNVLFDQMIDAEEMTIEYLPDNPDEEGKPRMARTKVSLKGIGDAVSWCESRFVSPEAFRLYPKP